MNKIILVLLISLLTVSFSYSQVKDKNIKGTNKTELVKTVKIANTICPVSGEAIKDNNLTYEYKGITYALCCKSCLKKFKNDPEKYISRLSEDGKSLKKKQ